MGTQGDVEERGFSSVLRFQVCAVGEERRREESFPGRNVKAAPEAAP